MIEYRLARSGDIRRTYEVMLEAEGDLARSRQMAIDDLTMPDERRALAARRASLEDFPERFWIAESEGTAIGFGIAYLRGRYCHLKSLQVVPAFQGRGIGRELMRRCMADLPAGAVRSVVSEAIQPVSNGLYLSAGMAPRLVVYSLTGDPSAKSPVAGRLRDLRVTADARIADLDALDRAVLGYARPDAHRLWQSLMEPDRRVVVRDGRDCVGYAYIGPDGTIGPTLGRSAADAPVVVDHALQRLAELGGTSATVLVPGTLRPVIDRLLRRRFRIGPVSLLFMASAPLRAFRLHGFSPDGVL